MVALWIVGVGRGLAVASFGSRRAVTAAVAASAAPRISPALIGVTLVAVGTDLPEIANSISAALTDHGDIVVGDAAGSAMTQVSLVLAIICVVAVALPVERSTVLLVGGLTTVALLLDAVIVRDGMLSRLDGAPLITIWVGAERTGPVPDMMRALAWLLLVAVAATLVVESFVRLTDVLGVPELVASAVVLLLGTSLPELVVGSHRTAPGRCGIGRRRPVRIVDARRHLGARRRSRPAGGGGLRHRCGVVRGGRIGRTGRDGGRRASVRRTGAPQRFRSSRSTSSGWSR